MRLLKQRQHSLQCTGGPAPEWHSSSARASCRIIADELCHSGAGVPHLPSLHDGGDAELEGKLQAGVIVVREPAGAGLLEPIFDLAAQSPKTTPDKT